MILHKKSFFHTVKHFLKKKQIRGDFINEIFQLNGYSLKMSKSNIILRGPMAAAKLTTKSVCKRIWLESSRVKGSRSLGQQSRCYLKAFVHRNSSYI